MLWKLECPVGLHQREISVHFNEENVDGPPENKFWSYVVVLNLIDRKEIIYLTIHIYISTNSYYNLIHYKETTCWLSA